MIIYHCDRPNNFNALNAVAKATSSGVFFMKAAIISTIAGKLHGSFRWKVQYLNEIKTIDFWKTFSKFLGIKTKKKGFHLCKYKSDLSVIPVLTCWGNLEALVFGYINGESVSTNNRSNGNMPSSSNFLTPVSDLSLKKIYI